VTDGNWFCFVVEDDNGEFVAFAKGTPHDGGVPGFDGELNTMSAYASAVFDAMEFDAATVHAYHGSESVSVFTRYRERGVYVVCHTSNPGRADLQLLTCGSPSLVHGGPSIVSDRRCWSGHVGRESSERCRVLA
jgi:hypothetical protein